MIPDPEYCISVLCHNRLEMTKRCLDTVRLHSPPRTQVVVTDNGSKDGTPDYLRELQGQDHRLEVVWNQSNLGVGAPKRHAVSLCRAPYFVSLDNDAWVGPGWLAKLRQPMNEDPTVAQVGRAGTCQHLSNDGEGRPGGPLEYVDGSAFMVRTEVLRKFPVCDPLYAFAYCDDSDFSLRIRSHGHNIATRSVPIWHPDGEHNKQDHGGVDISGYNHLSRVAFCHRWRDYLRRRAFDPTIALRRTGAMGDVLLCGPLATRLKGLWPQSTVFFGTAVPEAAQGHPAIDHVVTLAEWEKLYVAYAWNLDGIYEQDLGTNYGLTLLRHLGIFADTAEPDPLEFQVQPVAMARSRKLVPNADGRPIAVVCLQDTTWPGKNIHKVSWIEALEWLVERGYCIVETGTGNPTVAGGAIQDATAATNLQELGALLRRAHLYLGVEAGTGHLAQALGTVSVVQFGCTAPQVVATRTDRLVPISRPDLDCIGCHHRDAPAGGTSFRGCAREDLACTRPGASVVLDGIRAGAEMAEDLWGKGERKDG